MDSGSQRQVMTAGVDEAGRGPLAGPVVAAAVILDPSVKIQGLADSKKLTERKRVDLEQEIKENCLAWSIASVTHEEIDQINILNATMLAMKKAIESLEIVPGHVQVDGNRCPQVDCSVEAIVRGDALIEAIGAASILAKVCRDQIMMQMEEVYPGYGFARHKGYPTKEHVEALQNLGVCDIHRRSYAPVRNCL